MDRWIEISENIKKGKGCVYIKEKVGRVYDLPSSKIVCIEDVVLNVT